jgi:hypothetical protein
MFGNANPHYISDWIQNSIDSNNDKSDMEGALDQNAGSCSFPSAHVVQFFYSKINTVDDP